MDKLFNQHLQETFDYFKKNENVNIFSNYDYLSSDTALFEEYVTRMTEGMSAENAAVSSIEFLLKEINPDVEDLQVEVEFFDS